MDSYSTTEVRETCNRLSEDFHKTIGTLTYGHTQFGTPALPPSGRTVCADS